MHRILSLILWLGVATDLVAEPFIERLAAVHIVLVGDSTATDSAGWGKAFADLLAPGVRCTNTASGGQSSKSFRDTGRWAKALEARPTYILIQFGHNDMPGKGPHREMDPQTTYRENLGRFVDEARAAGAIFAGIAATTGLPRRRHRTNLSTSRNVISCTSTFCTNPNPSAC